MSEAVQNIFGYTSQEFYNNPELWYNIILEEDRKKLLIDPINKNIIEGKWEYRIIRKDGKIRWVCNKMFRKIDKNKNDTLFGTVRDITEEKKNIEVISLLEHLINNLDYAVWIIAFNEDWFEYIYVNNGVQNVFNEPKETFYKNPYHLGSLLHPDDKNDVEKWWDRMKEENNTINSKDYRIIRNDGKVCSIEDTHCKMSKFNERMCVMGILKLKKIE